MKKLTLILIPITLALLIGCTRELAPGGERPKTPFRFDRIPAVDSPGAQNPDQLSTGGTEGPGIPGTTEPGNPSETDIQALYEGGRAALARGDLDLAIEYLSSVVEAEPKNVGALYNLGYAYRRKGDIDKAIEFSKRAVEADPKRLYVHQNLAFAYESKGEMDLAITEFEQELLNHPDEPKLAGVAEKLALIYLDRDLLEEAFDAANRSVKLEPEKASHYVVLSKVHLANGAIDQALAALEKAVSLDSENAEYRKLLGDALWDAGRREEARRSYNEAVTLDPKIADKIPPERLKDSGDSDTGAPVDKPI